MGSVLTPTHSSGSARSLESGADPLLEAPLQAWLSVSMLRCACYRWAEYYPRRPDAIRGLLSACTCMPQIADFCAIVARLVRRWPGTSDHCSALCGRVPPSSRSRAASQLRSILGPARVRAASPVCHLQPKRFRVIDPPPSDRCSCLRNAPALRCLSLAVLAVASEGIVVSARTTPRAARVNRKLATGRGVSTAAGGTRMPMGGSRRSCRLRHAARR